MVRPSRGVGGLDLLAADAEQVHDRVQVGHVDRRVARPRCTTGLALKAMPRPGGGEHVEVVGAVADRDGRGLRDARLARRTGAAPSALPARSTTAPTIRPVSLPSTISSSLAAAKSMPRSAASRSVTGVNPPLHDREAVAEPLQRAHQRAGARGEHQVVVHPVERGGVAAPRAGRPGRAGSVEVELAAHRPLGDRARPRSSQPACAASISITSPWTSVESTSITIRRMPCRSRFAGCTATSTAWRGGLRGEDRRAAGRGRRRRRAARSP